MIIRFARAEDAQALLDIYAQYIHTPITFEYELPSAAEFARRISSTLADGYPYLVCQDGDEVLGYAYAHRLGERAAYQWNAELSIYLSSRAAGRGLGTALYLTLMDLLRLQGVKTVCGIVTRPNPASEGLHRALGFQLLGVYRHTGFKCGKWHDVGWFEKALSPCTGNPQPVLPIHRLDEKQRAGILRAFAQPDGQR